MARRSKRNRTNVAKTVTKNRKAQLDRSLARKLGRNLPLEVSVSPAVRQERKPAIPPEREIVKRKKPIKKWSDINLRLRCKDRPKDNKPKGAGVGQSREYVPWC